MSTASKKAKAPGTTRSRAARPSTKTSKASVRRTPLPRDTLQALPARQPALLDLDWSQFRGSESGNAFEELAIDLFVEEYGEEHFVPNRLGGGTDGGLDGLYDAPIGQVGGPWKIACAVRQSFAEAKKKVIQENLLSRKAKVRGLFFITSYNASALQVRELQRLAATGLDGAKVWCRSHLARLLRDQPWMRHVHFHQQLVPGFVPAGDASTLDDQSQPDLELVGRALEAERLRALISGPTRVVVIVAPGGSGKTRLLRALPSILKNARPRRSVWLRRVGQGTIEESLRSGLPARRAMLLCLDDAAQARYEVDELARVATTAGIDAKVLLAVRSVDRPTLEARIGGLRASVAWIDLSELSEADAIRVATLECPGLQQRDARRLARSFGTNLFLLRAAAQQVKSGHSPRTIVDDRVMRGLIATRFLDEAHKHLLDGSARRETLEHLAAFALNAPVPFTAATTIDTLATLYHAGMLRRVGDTLRFRRDVEGDLLLADLVERPVLREMFQQSLASSSPDELAHRARNLGAAGRGHAADLLTGLVRRWRSAPEVLTSPRAVLELLPHCAQAAPQDVAALCLEIAAVGASSTDHLGPVVFALGLHDAARALALTGALARAPIREGTYSDYKLPAIPRTLLNPFFHSAEELDEVYRLLEHWLVTRAPEVSEEIVAASLDTLLCPIFHWHENDGAALTMHERALPATAEILALRRRATSLLALMLAHPEPSMRAKGVEVLAHHGTPRGGRIETNAFDEAIEQEFATLVPVLQRRLETEDDIAVLCGIYGALAKRWATVRPGAASAAELLRGRTFDPLLKAYHLTSSSWEWFYDFDEVMRAAPAEPAKRWHWWVDSYSSWREKESERERLIVELASRYTDVRGLVRCVAVLRPTTNHALVLDAWCRRAPDLFAEAEAAATNEYDRQALHCALRRHRYRLDPSLLLADLKALPEPIAAADVAPMLDDAPLHAADVEELARYLVALPDVSVRRLALELVRHRGAPAVALDVLEHALCVGDWVKEGSLIWSIIQHDARQALLADRPALRLRLGQRFLDSRRTHCDPWYEERIVEILYGDRDAERLELLDPLVATRTYAATRAIAALVAPLATNEARFDVLIEKVVSIVATAEDDGFDAAQRVLGAAIDDEAPLALFDLAQDLLAATEPARRTVGLVLLSFGRGEPAACARAAELAVAPGESMAEHARSVLWSFSRPRGVWGRSPGEPAPALVALRDNLRQAIGLARVEARRDIHEVLRAVEARIAEDSRDDEEELAPS